VTRAAISAWRLGRYSSSVSSSSVVTATTSRPA
jgi:hypothetical protein